MSFRLDEVPQEVKEVWYIQIASELSKTGIGSKVWNECQRVINKYPEWFDDNSKCELPKSKELK